MVKDDRMNLKSAWIWQSVMVFVYVSMSAFMSLLSSDSPSPSQSIQLEFLFLAAYWAGLAIVSYERGRRWKPVNERRQMAAAWGFAARVPLAQPHPLPNVGALPLPFTITLKPAWPKFLLGLGLMGGGVLFILACFFPVIVDQGVPLNDPFFGPLFLCCALFVAVLILLWLRPQQMIVTQDGLTVRHATGGFHGTDWIYWKDARLFAIRGGKPGMPATRYELSGPYSVVKWTRTRGGSWSLHRPGIPFAEYEAQMEALIALISGVTGLPLYDVR